MTRRGNFGNPPEDTNFGHKMLCAFTQFSNQLQAVRTAYSEPV